jgi:ketosteroid isomerase-like protein
MAQKQHSDIRDVLDSWINACQAKDIDRLMSLYAADIVYFDVVPPLQFTGPDQVRRNFLRWFDEYDGPIGLEVRDLSVVESADVAFANMVVLDSGTRNNGIEGTVPVRATVCLRRSSDEWLITHEHISIPVGWTPSVEDAPAAAA